MPDFYTSQAFPKRRKLTVLAICTLVNGSYGLLPNERAWLNQRVSKPVLNVEKSPQQFIEDLNTGNIPRALRLFAEDCSIDFVSFSKPCLGLDSLERRLRLLNGANPNKKKMIIVDECISDGYASTAVKFRIENTNDSSSTERYTRGVAFFMTNNDGLIQNGFWVQETSNKAGELGLNLLRVASKIRSLPNFNTEPRISSLRTLEKEDANTRQCAPVKYFAAWNRRDIEGAVALFDEDTTYDDTAFPKPFSGKDAVKKHFLLCAECFPDTFTFEVDNVVDSRDTVCVKWHVADNGEQLPFTRGCSFYKINDKGKIADGIDFVEPAVFKPGGVELVVESLKSQISGEPIRLVPLLVWAGYIAIVFFSDGILPGANAVAFEQRTWEEVRDLSLNFFLVSPILNLPFSPVVHPMLEGVFNLLLSWAAMFAGFLSDDRKDKPNVFGMVPAVAGMQLLTSAFLLPYLATRSNEIRTDVSDGDLSRIARVCENPILGIIMGSVGSLSIGWALFGRQSDFGDDFLVRSQSFIDLLSIDRVGSSFIVDLIIFALFQCWLIDDDMKRRGVEKGNNSILILAAKFVPFFGMSAYLALRPRLPQTHNST